MKEIEKERERGKREMNLGIASCLFGIGISSRACFTVRSLSLAELLATRETAAAVCGHEAEHVDRARAEEADGCSR